MNRGLALIFGVVMIVSGLTKLATMTYEAGFKAGRESVKPIRQCTTDQHISWWFGGDPSTKQRALKRACQS